MSKLTLHQLELDKLLNFQVNSVNGFNNYDSLYLGTNESLSNILPKDLKLVSGPVLTVTASGDAAVEFIRLGATELDCFDINYFSKYMMDLKIASIKALNYEEFIKFYSEGPGVLNAYLFYEKISYYLSPRVFEFWNYVYQHAKQNHQDIAIGDWLYSSSLFEHLAVPYQFLSEQDSYLNESAYYKTKAILTERDIKINYIDKSLAQLDSSVLQKEYELIYLSNIIEYLPNYELKTLRAFRQLVDYLLINHTSNDGLIILAYLCQVRNNSKVNIAAHDETVQQSYFSDCEFSTFPNIYNNYLNDQTIVYRKRQK